MDNYTKLFIVMLLVLVTSINAINAADISDNETSLNSLNVETSANTHITSNNNKIESSMELNSDDNKNIIKTGNIIKANEKVKTITTLDEPNKEFELQNDVELTGTLMDYDDKLGLKNLPIGIYQQINGKDEWEGPSSTGYDGKFSYLFEAPTVGTYKFSAYYNGDDQYYSSGSDIVEYTVVSATNIILDETSFIWVNKSNDITGKIVDIRGNGIPNQIITFKDNTGRVLGSVSSNSEQGNEGKFTFGYVSNTTGQIELTATFAKSGYYLETNKSTTLNVIDARIFLDEPATPLSIAQPTITGNITISNGTKVEGQKIHIYVNDNYNGFISTDINGKFTYILNTTDSVHPITMGNYIVTAESFGNPYPETSSNAVNVKIINPRTITLNQSTIETKINIPTNISGKLTAADGSIQSGKTINLKNSNETVATTTTGEDGSFTLELTITTPQTSQYNVTYESEDNYESASTPVTLKVDDVPILTINVLADGIYMAPEITGNLTLSNGSALLNQRIDIYVDGMYNGKVDSVAEDGTFEYTIYTDNMRAGEHVVTAKTSYSPYPDIESNNITVKYVCGVTIEASPVSNMSIYHPAKVTGNVSAQDGVLLSGETLTLANDGIFMNTTKVNDDGSFTFDFTPTKPGLQKYSVGFESEYYQGITHIYLNIADVGELILNNATSPALVTEATINGTLKSLTGKFIGGQELGVYVNGWYNGKVTTSEEDGTFTYKLNTSSGDNIFIGENTVKAKTINGNYSDIESNQIVMTLISPTTIKLDETRATGETIIITRNNTLTTITGQLVDYYDYGIEKQIIILKQGTETIKGVTTGDNGKFTVEVTPQVIGTSNYELIYESIGLYLGTTENFTLEVTSETTLTIDEIENPVYLNEKINITGKLVDSEGNSVINQPINLYINNMPVNAAITTSSENGKEGTFTYETTFNEVGKYNISTEFLGTYHYNDSKSNVIEFVVKDKTRIEYEILNDVEEKAVLVFYVYDSENNLINGAKVNLSGDINETNVLTVMVYKNSSIMAGNYTVTIKYEGTDTYNQSMKEITFTIKEDPEKINEKLEEQIKDLNKTIEELTKSPLNTTITINPVTSSIGSITTLTANIKDENNKSVTGGKVIFKVNGITLKDENNNVIYADVKNSIASINYKVQEAWIKNNSYVEAVYSGSEKYNSARTKATDVLNITPGKVNITLEKESITAKSGETVTIRVKIIDSNGDRVNKGKVIFKLNGITLKDENGKAITAQVIDGDAVRDYIIPSTFSAKTYTLTAIYTANNYERIETTSKLTIEKKGVTINTDSITTTDGKTIIKATITDETGKLLVKSTKIAIKVNGKTILNNATSNNGIIDLSFTQTFKAGMYELLIISAENGIYKSGKMTTVLKI